MSKIKVMSVTGNPDLLHFKTLAQTERKNTYVIQEMHESEYDHQVKLLKRDASLRVQIKRLQPLCNSAPFTMDDSFMSKTVKRPLLLIQNGTPTVHATRKAKFTQSIISQAYESQLKFFNQRKSGYAQITLNIEDTHYQLILELYHEFAPKACENFIKFCQGVNIDGKQYTYKNTKLKHKPNGFLQGGHFDKKISIFGGYFEDESYAVKHDSEGVIGIANDGFQHTNHSQFYLTLAPMPSFNFKRVAFAKVIRGMKFLLKALKSDTLGDIFIEDCGLYDYQAQIKLKLEKFTDDFSCIIPENAINFSKFIENEQLKHDGASGDFTQLVKFLVEQTKQINKYAYSTTSQKKAIQQLTEAFNRGQPCQILYLLDNQKMFQSDNLGKYIVAMRAIDGSDSCRATAFIIFKKQTTMFKQVTLNDFKQNAEQLVAVCYCVHGQTTQMVLGIGYNLSMFTLFNNDFKLQQQEYYIKQCRLQIPTKEKFYSNDIRDDYLQKIISNLPTKFVRYTNSVFTSLHRVVRLGGLVMYKEVSIFEAIICAFVLSRSWGWSFCDGTTTFNQIKIREINQSTYLYLGQQKWIQQIENHFLSIV